MKTYILGNEMCGHLNIFHLYLILYIKKIVAK